MTSGKPSSWEPERGLEKPTKDMVSCGGRSLTKGLVVWLRGWYSCAWVPGSLNRALMWIGPSPASPKSKWTDVHMQKGILQHQSTHMAFFVISGQFNLETGRLFVQRSTWPAVKKGP